MFLGEILGYAPCVLCWYQRICMFPLVLVLAAGAYLGTLRLAGVRLTSFMRRG